MNEIEKVQPNELAESPRRELSVMQMLQGVIDGGVTESSVAVMKELVQLKRDMDADEAKRAFNRAFIALKRDVKPIAALKVIPTRDGGVKGKFAPLADIKGEIDPLLERHGFTDTYDQEPAEGNRTKVTCTLVHESGHERSSSFTTRMHASPNNTDAQNDGGTSTLARRYALCHMLGIVFDTSADARLEGDTITPSEAADVERRVLDLCGGDVSQVARYLRLAGADSFDTIRRAKYDVLVANLDQRERRAGTEPSGTPKYDRQKLAASIVKWAGVSKEEQSGAMRSACEAAGFKSSGKATDEQIEQLGDWYEANKGLDFFEAISPKGRT